MNSTSLTKPVDLQGLSLALAKMKSDYEGKITNHTDLLIVNISWSDGDQKFIADKKKSEVTEAANKGSLICGSFENAQHLLYYNNGSFFNVSYKTWEEDSWIHLDIYTYVSDYSYNLTDTTQDLCGENMISNYFLSKGNVDSYTPTGDYNPATKKYVDDHVGVTSFNGNTGAVTYTAPVTSVNSKTGAVVVDKIKTGSAQNSTEYQIMAIPENDNHSSPVFIYDEVMATIAKYAGNYARLTLGTSTTPGVVRLYSNDKVDYYTDIKASTASSNKTIVFPNADGTVALTSDILSNLSELSDATISSPTNGQVLTYDSTTSKWINSTPSSGVTEARVNELIAAALAQYGDGDTMAYGGV